MTRTHHLVRVSVPPRPEALLLVLPGGKPDSTSPSRGWHLSNVRMAAVADTLRRALPGTAVYRLRYRHRGWNEPALPAVADGRAALATLAEEHPGRPVVLVGHSMGGRVAAALADDPAVVGVLALAPWWPQDDADAIPADTPLVVVHGSADTWTSPRDSHAAVQRARARGGRAQHHQLRGAGHFMFRGRTRWNAAITAGVRELLGRSAGAGVAARVAGLAEQVMGGDLPVHLVAWDGTEAGAQPGTAPTVRLTASDALRRVLWSPGELGAAQAYVTGALEVDGDLAAALRHVRLAAAGGGVRPRPRALPARVLLDGLGLARHLGILRGPLPPPPTQVRVRGRLHSPGRDRAVIRGHYDLSNDFYATVLDDRLTYSCGYVTAPGVDLCASGEDAGYLLEDAQRDKLDLVCRKLRLNERPGQRLLDVGCGWGALALHAAEHHGAIVVGVTLSSAQAGFAIERAAARGLSDRVEIRVQDFREIGDPPFDAVASLEMGEHVGERNYPTYAATLARCAAPGAPVLVQQMSRAAGSYPGGGPFIEAFIAPDMTMRPVRETIGMLAGAGMALVHVEDLREHYVWTVRSWEQRFRRHRTALVDLVGEEVCRVWDLYLAGGALAFAEGRMGVEQILLERPR